MRRRGPLPRPALQEIGLAAPEGVPPVVMPVQEMPREMGPAPDVLSAEERPEPGRASPPLEVRRQAERGAVEGAPSPERAAEGERRRPPVAAEGGARGVSPSVTEPRVDRQLETPAEPARGAEPQVAPRPSVMAPTADVARRASAGQEAVEGAQVRETRDLQLSRLVEETRKEPEDREAIQRTGDLEMAPSAEVPSVQPRPEGEDAGLTAMPSPAEAGEAVPRYRDLEQASLGPAAPEPGVGREAQRAVSPPSRPRDVVATPSEAVGPRAAARLGVQRAREPEDLRQVVHPLEPRTTARAPTGAGREGIEALGAPPAESPEPEAGVVRQLPEAVGQADVQLSYTALGPEYDELRIGVEPSRAVFQRQAPGALPPLAARREVPAEEPIGEAAAPHLRAAAPHLRPERDLGA
ncbi:MAG: hypothetical protein E3J25_06720, partial [Anaerolineales bacterium]